ncbi:MAG: TetR/AcrR family transcriptional regulator [Deltaproteobacteria bacterium]|nr:TetR/AcrR family transcriptional regulator [Deltaproteobacteria bacterium]
MKAAVSEFSDNGFKGASVNRLATTLGISKGSIFQYFRNKNGLFLFVFEHAILTVKDYLKRVRSETEDLDVFERIRETLLAGVAFVRKNPKVFNVYLRIVHERSIPMRGELIHAVRALSLEYLHSMLEEGQKRGELRPDVNLKRTAFFLDAILDRFLQAYNVPHLDGGLDVFHAAEDAVNQWADELVELLRSGLGK